jgi:hypothetical protein
MLVVTVLGKARSARPPSHPPFVDAMYACFPSPQLLSFTPVWRQVPATPLSDRRRQAYIKRYIKALAVTAPPAVVKAMLGPGSLLQEEMLLAPFLRNRDLMLLSEAAVWLEPYRHQLAEMVVKSGLHSRAVVALQVQRRLHTIRLVLSFWMILRREPGRCVVRLFVELGGLLHEATLLTWACGCASAVCRSTRRRCASCGRALRKGCARRCRSSTSASSTSCTGTTAARYLREGLPGCPDLRRLRLCLGDPSAVVALATALEQGLYPKLEALSVTASSEGADGGEVVTAAFRAFPRPGLRELSLDVLSLGPGLAEALQSGACRGLTRLSLKASSFGEGMSVRGLVDSFGACPDLRELALDFMSTNGDGLYRAIADAVREGGLSRLERLSLINEDVGDDSAQALAEALEARGGSLSHHIDSEARACAHWVCG